MNEFAPFLGVDRSWSGIVACLLGALLLGGCVVAPPGVTQSPDAADALASRPPVLAVIDTGVNPYHEAFLGTAWAPPEAALLELATAGDYAERVASDESTWGSVQPGVLYRLGTTRLLGISFTSEGSLILDQQGHGTATAGLAARSSSQATIVMVQVDPRVCVESATECFIDPSVAAAMEWVAAQPWIDVVSISLNNPVSKPRVEATEPEAQRFLDASRRAHDRGVLIVNSAGNYPVPTSGDYFAGPPWVVAVGGAQGAKRGATVVNSKLVDVVANVTEEVALRDATEGTRFTSGTSMGTPIVAGTLAEALSRVRTDIEGEDAVATRDRLRAALNATAIRWGAGDFDVTGRQDPDLVFDLIDPAVPVVAGPAQVGWGYVDAAIAPALAATALGDAAAGPPGAEYALIMSEQQAQRERAWGEA